MIDFLNTTFIDGGIYKLKDMDRDSIFLSSTTSGKGIGKITRYKRVGDKLYEKTPTSYFLSFFTEGDLKQLFVKRDNYDMVGMLGKNYFISTDYEKSYILFESDSKMN